VRRFSSFVCTALMTTTIVSSVPSPVIGPVWADDRVNEVIRRQQKEDCERQGGQYDYPKCYLPDRRSQSSSSSSSCGWMCKLTIGVAALVVGSVAYCKANPGKC